MPKKIGLNKYIIEGNAAIIYLQNGLETKIDAEDMQKFINLGYHWYARWDYRSNSYYACSSSIRGTTLSMHIMNDFINTIGGKPDQEFIISTNCEMYDQEKFATLEVAIEFSKELSQAGYNVNVLDGQTGEVLFNA
jgi:hypothetical protein